jgi:Flp pilus assembly pilin Flp
MDLFIFRTWLSAKLHRNEQGANLVEYILLIAFIAIVVLIAVQTLGTTVSTKFSSTTSSLS